MNEIDVNKILPKTHQNMVLHCIYRMLMRVTVRGNILHVAADISKTFEQGRSRISRKRVHMYKGVGGSLC